MFFGTMDALDWRAPEEALIHENAARRTVLTHRGMLTRLLTTRFGLRLELALEHQGMGALGADEARWLGLPAGEPAWRRRVRFVQRGETLIAAESVLPARAWPAQVLARLGHRPLAETLEGILGVRPQRLAMRLARIPHGDWRGCWARASLLAGNDEMRALVVEVFTPQFWLALAGDAQA